MGARAEANRTARDGCSSWRRSAGSSCGPGLARVARTAGSRATFSTLTTRAECGSPAASLRACLLYTSDAADDM
eukprot:10464290-Alexandrium_andersonii.AAC.1